MSIAGDVRVPEPGQAVLVRGRPGAVRNVSTYGAPDGLFHLVEVEYLDGWEFPSEDRVLWEREWRAGVLTGAGFPRVDDLAMPPDPPPRFAAFIDALRWTSVSRLPGLTTEGDELISPWQGAVAIEDYQLLPVLKALEMPRVSLLLADDVGLGKTIEAGLILTELIARRRIRRVLVVCPASLQLQWREEMADKFSLDFLVLDRAAMIDIQREYGMDANPWAVTPRAITSMDFLRQPDVLSQFLAAAGTLERGHALAWDFLVVDEAHNLAPHSLAERSDRSRMLGEISPHFEHRLFLTATPHNGFTYSFTGLLELLDPVRFRQTSELSERTRQQLDTVMIRRMKSDLNRRARAKGEPTPFADRTVEGVPFQRSPAERDLADALTSYRRAGATLLEGMGGQERGVGRFLFSLLTKRLLSSPFAFARTWWKHVEGFDDASTELAELEVARRRAESLTSDDTEKALREEDVARQGASWLARHRAQLRDPRDQVSNALRDLGWPPEAALADLRSGDPLPADGKWDAFCGWLERYLKDAEGFRHGERVILFTEYKDTHDELCSRLAAAGLAEPLVQFLFGGSSLAERGDVKARFNDPEDPLRILVATDVASEGLNLQNSCRYVFHWEIPWNPMRLEQRNGRVDRHGQARDVVAFHFTSNEDEDLKFLDYVVHKVEQVRDDVGSVSVVIDAALDEHFTVRPVGAEQLDERVTHTLTFAPERTDLAGHDDEELVSSATPLARLTASESRLHLGANALARLLGNAADLDGGRLAAVTAGEYRFDVVPPSWQRLVDDHLRLRGGRQDRAMPRMTFDADAFVERVSERKVFRPRPDLVLMRLGHPVMRRALAGLRRRLWDPDGNVSRWTVSRHRGLDTAVVVLYALAEATNELRESVHSELLTYAYTLEGLKSTEPPTDDGDPLTIQDLTKWRRRLAGDWDDLRGGLSKCLGRERDALERKSVSLLDRAQKEERKRQEQLYTDRIEELKLERGDRLLQRLRRELALAKQRADQLTFDADENEANLRAFERASRRLDDAQEFERLESQRERLRLRLEADRIRLLEDILPRRFSLERFELSPVGVAIALPVAEDR